MANTKISALPLASTPLAGTEVLPIVQGGITEQIATNDLTVRNVRANATTGILQVTGPAAASTRVMTTPDANFTVARTDAAQSFTGDQTLSTGNLIIGTSGKGIDFSATPGTGTSELFADYEEGTFTPTMTSASGLITLTASSGSYTKIGNIVSIRLSVTFNSDASVGTSTITIGGLPFTCNSSFVEKAFLSYSNTTSTDYGDGYQQVFNSATSINWAFRTNSLSSRTGSNLMFVTTYRV